MNVKYEPHVFENQDKAYLGSQTRAVHISRQIKFAQSCLLLDLDSPLQACTRSRTHLCCRQNILAAFISAFRRNKARDKNEKKVPGYTSI